MKTEMRTSRLIVVAALLMLAAPAMAEPAPSMPFVIDGYVHEFCGDPCNGTWVQITNASVSWDAENSSDSNHYRLVLDSSDVSADNVLWFDASGCFRSKTIEYTVTAGEIRDGGFTEEIK